MRSYIIIGLISGLIFGGIMAGFEHHESGYITPWKFAANTLIFGAFSVLMEYLRRRIGKGKQ